MRLLADECCDARIVGGLREAGHDVSYAAEELIAENDRRILQAAYDQDRVLYTEDADFGYLAVRQKFPCRGVILLRGHSQPWGERLQRINEELDRLGERLTGSFTVIDPVRTRLRPLSDR